MTAVFNVGLGEMVELVSYRLHFILFTPLYRLMFGGSRLGWGVGGSGG